MLLYFPFLLIISALLCKAFFSFKAFENTRIRLNTWLHVLVLFSVIFAYSQHLLSLTDIAFLLIWLLIAVVVKRYWHQHTLISSVGIVALSLMTISAYSHLFPQINNPVLVESFQLKPDSSDMNVRWHYAKGLMGFNQLMLFL